MIHKWAPRKIDQVAREMRVYGEQKLGLNRYGRKKSRGS
ncbi:hypothetical protein RintRC_3034 [Richelia intracellularis]|nr:hypothetical protein RintRC_3034 [Richelia intracellularis]